MNVRAQNYTIAIIIWVLAGLLAGSGQCQPTRDSDIWVAPVVID